MQIEDKNGGLTISYIEKMISQQLCGQMEEKNGM
jgi:hypothetical protein